MYYSRPGEGEMFYQTIEEFVADLIVHPDELNSEAIFGEAVDELALLLSKIHADEDLIARAEAYFRDCRHRWSDGVVAHFEIFLERKRDQIHYEKHRADKMGWAIALEHYPQDLDI